MQKLKSNEPRPKFNGSYKRVHACNSFVFKVFNSVNMSNPDLATAQSDLADVILSVDEVRMLRYHLW